MCFSLLSFQRLRFFFSLFSFLLHPVLFLFACFHLLLHAGLSCANLSVWSILVSNDIKSISTKKIGGEKEIDIQWKCLNTTIFCPNAKSCLVECVEFIYPFKVFFFFWVAMMDSLSCQH